MNPELNITTKKKKRIEKQNRRRHPEISKEIILLWEELRQKAVNVQRKRELCDKIMSVSKSVLGELIRSKVTARVFESVIEFGEEEHRWTIFEIIKTDLLDLCKEKYAYFAVVKMLKHGTKEQRLSVFQLLNGHIVDLLPHMFASKVVEAAYNEFANAKQRSQMIQEFYGRTFALFHNGSGQNDPAIKHLADFTSSSSYDRSILAHLHKVLLPIINKQQIDLTIVQHVLSEYISVLLKAKSDNDSELSKPYVAFLDEIVDLLHEQLLKLCNTRQGVKVAITVFYQCSAKMRKKIVQACKEVVVDLCCHTDAHLFVLAVLDQTDDTKLLNKSLIRPIVVDNIDAIVANVHGRKVINFLLCHRDSRVFAKFVLDILRAGDGNDHSKKESAVRATEIVDCCKKPLLLWLEAHIDECLNRSDSVTIVHSVMTSCVPSDEDDKQRYRNILSAIATHIDAPVTETDGLKRKSNDNGDKGQQKNKKRKMFTGQYKTDDEPEPMDTDELVDSGVIDTNIVENLGGNVLMKALCKLENKGIIDGFSSLCMDNISIDTFQAFTGGNRTAFFLVFLFEIGNSAVQQFLRKHLKTQQNVLAKSPFKGAKILHELLFTE